VDGPGVPVRLLPAPFAATGIGMWWLKRRPAAAASPVIDKRYTARRAGE
jgi:hypothetical protein